MSVAVTDSVFQQNHNAEGGTSPVSSPMMQQNHIAADGSAPVHMSVDETSDVPTLQPGAGEIAQGTGSHMLMGETVLVANVVMC